MGVVIWWLWMMPEDQELYHLFAFPLECNFSGAKFDLDLVTQINRADIVEKNTRRYSSHDSLVLCT